MSDSKWFIVRLKCLSPPIDMGADVSYVEERRIWAYTQEDAIAKAAGESEAPTVVGATAVEEEIEAGGEG